MKVPGSPGGATGGNPNPGAVLAPSRVEIAAIPCRQAERKWTASRHFCSSSMRDVGWAEKRRRIRSGFDAAGLSMRRARRASARATTLLGAGVRPSERRIGDRDVEFLVAEVDARPVILRIECDPAAQAQSTGR